MARRASRSDDEDYRHTEDSAIASLIYNDPDPKAVAKLWASHDWEACLGRWHWIGARKLGYLARQGRMMLGWFTGNTRTRSTSTAEEAALIATAYALSNIYGAEIAAGAGKNALQIVFDAWGIPRVDRPKTQTAERSRNTLIGRGIAHGEAWAIEADAARRVHNRAVYEVVVAALAMLPESKPFGRPPLPEPSDALRAAVEHFPPAAVEAVFPGLVQNEPEESPVMTTTATTTPTGRVRRAGKGPDDKTLRARLAADVRIADIAAEFGVSIASIYAKRRALQPPAPPQAIEVQASLVPADPIPQAPAPIAEPEPVRTLVSVKPGAAALAARPLPLALEGLLRAREVVQACGCHPMEAIGLVRADMAHVMRESLPA